MVLAVTWSFVWCSYHNIVLIKLSIVFVFQEIYNKLCGFDTRGDSYVVEVSKNPTKVYDSMAQLLAHPLQRGKQNELFYSIELNPELPS